MIRVMTIDDYEAVLNLWLSIDGMGMRSLDDSREGIEKFLKRNPTTCFVFELDEMVIGAVLTGHDGRRGHIYHAAVLEQYRGKGYGKQLVDTALEALKKEGINKAALVVFRDNQLGNAFWKKYGFGERLDLVYRNKNLNTKNL